jgi:hypothetical protein
MATGAVCLRHHIKQERLDIIVKRLVVQEELCQKTQILAVELEIVF